VFRRNTGNKKRRENIGSREDKIILQNKQEYDFIISLKHMR
jgi:hypothetical protein